LTARFKAIDHVGYIPTVTRRVVTLLMFPPGSYTPSGFYLIEPDGVGGNLLTLVKEERFETRAAKGWYHGAAARAAAIRRMLEDPGSVVRRLMHERGAEWSSLPAEELTDAVLADPGAIE